MSPGVQGLRVDPGKTRGRWKIRLSARHAACSRRVAFFESKKSSKVKQRDASPFFFSDRGRPYLRRGVLHLQELENRRAVVGDRDVPDVVNEHFIQTDRAK